MEKVRLTTVRSEKIKDVRLARLDKAVRAQEALLAPMGRRRAASELEELDPDRPYDLEVIKPRAVDLRKLWKLAGKMAPPDIQATLGPKVPILLNHGMTPFHRPGEKPRGVWGMGYMVRLEEPKDAYTVSLVPETKMTKYLEYDGSVDVGLAFKGEMKVPDPALDVVSKVPGITLHGAEVNATTDHHFSLSINLEFSALKVQAGPTGAGSAKWNIYRRGERLDRFQPFLQTLLIPEEIDDLKMTIETWVVRRGRILGRKGSRMYSPPPSHFEVSLEGLED